MKVVVVKAGIRRKVVAQQHLVSTERLLDVA